MNIHVDPAQEVSVSIDLFKVAGAAIEADNLEMKRRFLEGKLKAAYVAWKFQHGMDRVERETSEWSDMLEATKAQYSAVVDAKRHERNAKRRLATAVDRARKSAFRAAVIEGAH